MHRYAQSGNHSNERPGYVIDLNGLCSLISKLKIRVSVVRLESWLLRKRLNQG
jgi:hypothetical protein